MRIEIFLRDAIESDLPVFFKHELNFDVTRMAAFPTRDKVPSTSTSDQ